MKKNIERLNVLRKLCEQLHNIGVHIDGGIEYNEYMRDSVGEFLYESEEKDGEIDDEFVRKNIEPEIEAIKRDLDLVKKMCNYIS